MKRVVLLLAASPVMPSYAQETYVFAENRIEDIFFRDSEKGWIVGRLGEHSYVWRTRNGGNTWQKAQLPVGLERIFFESDSLGWGVINERKEESDIPSLWHSSDGGISWTHVSVLDGKDSAKSHLVFDFLFLDGRKGWFVGQRANHGSLVLYTKDGGRTVEPIRALSGLPGTPLRIVGDGERTLLIVGLDFLWLSKDEGRTWENLREMEMPVGTHNLNVESATFLPAGKILMAGEKGGGLILLFDARELKWNISYSAVHTVSYSDLSFHNAKEGCAVGTSTVLICTDDGGRSWRPIDSLPQADQGQARFFTTLIVLKTGRGWVLRAGGFLYETLNRGISWVPVQLN